MTIASIICNDIYLNWFSSNIDTVGTLMVPTEDLSIGVFTNSGNYNAKLRWAIFSIPEGLS
ncbi:MAG: hypothetical protein WBX01_13025 [Nitrososphaeraceae archaeon]